MEVVHVLPIILDDIKFERNLVSALRQYTDIWRHAYQRSVNEQSLQELDSKVNQFMSQMQIDFPETLQVVLWHLMLHLAEDQREHGPAHTHHMYPSERYF